MSQLEIIDTPLAGLKVIRRKLLTDQRGFLARIFSDRELAAAGWHKPIAQINHSVTRGAGTVRGMHFQRGVHVEMKLVTCLRGTVWDVAVDLRPDSPTYLRWHAQEISESNGRALLIPEGFAHGFQVQSAECDLLYLHSTAHAPQAEAGLNPRDPKLAIAWPLPITLMTERDNAHPMIDDRFEGLRP
jgi:dTDP-4-dehydrorhamnose 3,5-epimerase